MPGFYIDDPVNADWPKQTWDLLVTTPTGLRLFLQVNKISFEDFRTPVYRAGLKKFAWLRTFDPKPPRG